MMKMTNEKHLLIEWLCAHMDKYCTRTGSSHLPGLSANLHTSDKI